MPNTQIPAHVEPGSVYFRRCEFSSSGMNAKEQSALRLGGDAVTQLSIGTNFIFRFWIKNSIIRAPLTAE